MCGVMVSFYLLVGLHLSSRIEHISSSILAESRYRTTLAFRSQRRNEARRAAPLNPVNSCICLLYPTAKAFLTASICAGLSF